MVGAPLHAPVASLCHSQPVTKRSGKTSRWVVPSGALRVRAPLAAPVTTYNLLDSRADLPKMKRGA